MRSLRFALGLATLSATLCLTAACDQDVAAIGFDLRFPQGLLDELASMRLTVLGADGVSCDPATGEVTGTNEDTQQFELDRGGCADGAVWCKTITLSRDGNERVFKLEGFDPQQNLRARGCAVAAIDQDPLRVDIQALRANPPKCCGDGVLQVGEQCDTGGSPDCGGIAADAVCSADCVAQEILLSIDNTEVPVLTNAPGTKSELSLAFSGNQGTIAGALRALYVDNDATSAGTVPDINVRMLKPDLQPFVAPADPIRYTQQFRLTTCDRLDLPLGIPNVQKQPSAARVSEEVVGVAFASSQLTPPAFDVFVSAQGPSGCAEINDQPLQVNAVPASGGGSAELPAIAGGPSGQTLIAFNQNGALKARIWAHNQLNDNTDDTFVPPAADIDLAASAAGLGPRVAGSSSGWVVAYQTSQLGPVSYVTVDAGGNVGTAVQVSSSGEPVSPDVTMLSDGRFAVVWQSGGDIFFQRYDAAGAPVAGDQNAPLNSSGPGSTPAIAGTTEAGGFYVVAWLASDGAVWSRLIDGTAGFRTNSVTGQNGDYPASLTAGKSGRPAVAIGSGGVIAIGWSSDSGVHVRRFPFPNLFE